MLRLDDGIECKDRSDHTKAVRVREEARNINRNLTFPYPAIEAVESIRPLFPPFPIHVQIPVIFRTFEPLGVERKLRVKVEQELSSRSGAGEW